LPACAWVQTQQQRLGDVLAGTATVTGVMVSSDPLPSLLISTAIQQKYFGVVKNPLQVSIYQHSGIREIGYGPPWEGAI
jgi:hypothetical protein